jgi:hypothetical protein
VARRDPRHPIPGKPENRKTGKPENRKTGKLESDFRLMSTL